MDINELRKKPHLSVSGINDYLDCGLLYRFSRIDYVKPEFRADSLVFGNVIHKVMSEFHQERMIGGIMPLKEMQQLFEVYWIDAAESKTDIKYSKGKNCDTLLKDGKALLTAYYKSIPSDDFRILAIEEPFSFTIENLPVPIIGVIDLVEEDEETIIISDLKTSSKAYSTSDIDKKMQLTVYQMAAKRNGYINKEILLRFDVLIKTKQPKFEPYYTVRTEADERRAIKKILKVYEGISKGVFIPNDTSWKCTNCSYKNHCNDWFEKRGD